LFKRTYLVPRQTDLNILSSSELEYLNKKDVLIKNNINIVSLTIGVLLGDAYAEKRGNVRLTIKQSDTRKDWLFWLHGVYSDFKLCSSVKPKIVEHSLKGQTYRYCKFNTYTHPLFGIIYKLIYININGKNVKRLHPLLFNYIDAMTLAAWLSDDGSVRNGNSCFCTDNFSFECVDLLIKVLKTKFNINSYMYMHMNKYPRIQIDRKDMPKFALLVKSFLHESMHYKLGDFRSCSFAPQKEGY
jgi:hypothetical protein